MDTEITAGQLWVNAKIRELAKGRVSPVEAFEWEDSRTRNAKHFVEGSHGVTIWIGEERRVVRFLESELSDVECDSEVQVKITTRLKEVLS